MGVEKKKPIKIGDLVFNLVVEVGLKENEYILCSRTLNGNIHYHGYIEGGFIDGTRIIDVELKNE